MGMVAILIMWPALFEQILASPSHGGSTWNLDTDQWMALTLGTHKSSGIHLVDLMWQLSDHSLWIDCLFEIRKIAVCFLWLSLLGHYRVTDEALLAETT